MKKLVLAALIAISAMLATDTFARHYNYNNDCGTCAPRGCGNDCRRVCRVETQDVGPAPCCWTAVRVPAKLVEHRSFTWECPVGCTESAGTVADL